MGPVLRIADGIALSDNALPAEAGNTGWHMLAVEGAWKGHWQGPFRITRDTLQQMQDFVAAKRIATVVDYEHASVMFGQKAPAAGWLQEVDVRERDGQHALWGRVEWTAAAAEHIRSKEYRYLSPTIRWQTTDRVSGKIGGASLQSVALTNQPFLHELPEVHLNSLAAALAAVNGVPPMSTTAELAKLLGLKEDAAPEQLQQALRAEREGFAKLAQSLSLPPDASFEQVVSKLTALQTLAAGAQQSQAEIKALSERVTKFEAEQAQGQALALVRKYQAERKVAGDDTPHFKACLKHALTDPQGFTEMMDAMQPWVAGGDPVGGKKSSSTAASSDPAVQLQRAEHQLAANPHLDKFFGQLGLSAKELAESGKEAGVLVD